MNEVEIKRRVAVTGLGLITPLGNSVAETWSALIEGLSGVDYIDRFDASRFPVRIAAQVKNFDPLKYLEKDEARLMGSFAHYAIAASDQALSDSGLKITPDNCERVGTYISTGIGDFWAIECEHAKFLREGAAGLSQNFAREVFLNVAAAQVSIRFGAKGPISTSATACSAGAHAIGDSFKIIQRGDADGMICGGTEAAITPMTVAGFAAMRALSTRNDDPARASRPFDRDRNGFVMGEGAGTMVLEDLQTARRRGAHIYAEIIGYGMSADARHMTMPDENASGAVRAMRLALKDAGVGPGDVDYINAHGTSTPHNDRLETLAIKKVFAEHALTVPISSTKSMTGHLLGAAGGVEGVFSVLVFSRNKLPPTMNYEHPDPECDLDYIPNRSRDARVNCVLSNSFGFGGTNVALVFRRFKE